MFIVYDRLPPQDPSIEAINRVPPYDPDMSSPKLLEWVCLAERYKLTPGCSRDADLSTFFLPGRLTQAMHVALVSQQPEFIAARIDVPFRGLDHEDAPQIIELCRTTKAKGVSVFCGIVGQSADLERTHATSLHIDLENRIISYIDSRASGIPIPLLSALLELAKPLEMAVAVHRIPQQIGAESTCALHCLHNGARLREGLPLLPGSRDLLAWMKGEFADVLDGLLESEKSNGLFKLCVTGDEKEGNLADRKAYWDQERPFVRLDRLPENPGLFLRPTVYLPPMEPRERLDVLSKLYPKWDEEGGLPPTLRLQGCLYREFECIAPQAFPEIHGQQLTQPKHIVEALQRDPLGETSFSCKPRAGRTVQYSGPSP